MFTNKSKPSALSNPLSTHWRGEYALLPTLLVIVLLTRLAMGWLQNYIPVSLLNSWVVFSMVVFSIAVFIWQFVGAIRSTNNYFNDTGDSLAVAMAYGFLLVLSLLTFTQIADTLAAKNVTTTPIVKKPALPLILDKKAIKVQGNLDWELFASFKQTLTDTPGIEHVYLDSTGGYVFVARAMTIIILERELNTHVNNQCFSACTLAFLAGAKRSISDHAQLGFHRYKIAAGMLDLAEEHDKDRNYFQNRGLSNQFIEQVFSTENSELWTPAHSVLRNSGVVNTGL